MNEFHERGHEGVGLDIAEVYAVMADAELVTTMLYVNLDIIDKEAVEKAIGEMKSYAVIHCAEWTSVDMVKDDKIDYVRRINVCGTQNIAEACMSLDCKMLYLSTNNVLYGQTKLERAVD